MTVIRTTQLGAQAAQSGGPVRSTLSAVQLAISAAGPIRGSLLGAQAAVPYLHFPGLTAAASSDTTIDALLPPDPTITKITFQALSSDLTTVVASVVVSSPSPTVANTVALTGLTGDTLYGIRALVITTQGVGGTDFVLVRTLHPGQVNRSLTITEPTDGLVQLSGTVPVSWSSGFPAGTTYTVKVRPVFGSTTTIFTGTDLTTTWDSTTVTDGYYTISVEAGGKIAFVTVRVDNTGGLAADVFVERPTTVAEFFAPQLGRLWEDDAFSFWYPPPAYAPAGRLVVNYGSGSGQFSDLTSLALAKDAEEFEAHFECGFASFEYGPFWGRQLGAEGWHFGIAGLATGKNSDCDSIGVTALVTTSTAWPAPYHPATPCADPAYATANWSFAVGAFSPPGLCTSPASGGGAQTQAYKLQGISRCAVAMHTVSLRVTTVSGTELRFQGAVNGEQLVDTTFDPGVAFDCGYVGPVFGKTAGVGVGGLFPGAFAMRTITACVTTDEDLIPEPDELPEPEIFVPDPSRPCVVEAIIYEPDRVTPAWRVTDDPADPADVRLLMPLMSGGYGEQTIDPANGRASITQLTFEVNDPPTIPGDQDSGIVTGRLADLLQLSAINGRRVRVRRFINTEDGWITICDGPG